MLEAVRRLGQRASGECPHRNLAGPSNPGRDRARRDPITRPGVPPGPPRQLRRITRLLALQASGSSDRQVGPERCGAGSMPAVRRIFQTVEAAI
jgi:hypothetical protein